MGEVEGVRVWSSPQKRQAKFHVCFGLAYLHVARLSLTPSVKPRHRPSPKSAVFRGPSITIPSTNKVQLLTLVNTVQLLTLGRERICGVRSTVLRGNRGVVAHAHGRHH